jgi:hypothetical protein
VTKIQKLRKVRDEIERQELYIRVDEGPVPAYIPDVLSILKSLIDIELEDAEEIETDFPEDTANPNP